MQQYPEEMVQPMREELTDAGIKEVRTRSDVDNLMKDKTGTTLLFINSVCGCAASQARPGLVDSLKNRILPKRIYTAFAGMDGEAVTEARKYFIGYPPSSPCLAVFRNGDLVFFLQRTDFLNKSAEALSDILKSVYNKFCGDKVDEAAQISDGKSAQSLDVTVEDVKKMLDNNTPFHLLDVRTPKELEKTKLAQASLLDRELTEKILQTYPRDSKLVFISRRGERSLQATRYFKTQGFKNSFSMAGGIETWAQRIDSTIPLP